MRSISSSIFGVFAQIDGATKYIDSLNSENIKIVRRRVEEDSGSFIFQVEVTNESKIEIKINSILVSEYEFEGKPDKILENGWGQSSFSGYREKIVKTPRSKFFLKRDQNPYSFLESFGYLNNSMVNEWFTEMIFSDKSLVVGAVTSADQFTQIFLRQDKTKITIRVTCQQDGLVLKQGEKIISEKIAYVAGKGPKETLGEYADLMVRYSNTKKTKTPPVGLCCAYYYQGNTVSENYLLDQLRALSIFPKRSSLQYIEIDAGYCVWGDWLEVNNSFPSGFEKVVREINKAGLKAGIWLAPFVASPKSNVYANHPEWFLKGNRGRNLEGRQSSPIDFLPSLSLKVLDPTHPEVQKYIQKVIKQFLDMGFEMLKIDFTYPVCFSNNYYLPMTRAQALRLGYKTIREAAGEKTHLLSAITQLSPLVGVVDSARVGIDTINPYVSSLPIVGKMINNFMFKESLRNSSSRIFLNGKVWINDADCYVGRKGAGITETQSNELFDFMKKGKGAVWIGDSFKLMTKTTLDKYIDLFKKKEQ